MLCLPFVEARIVLFVQEYDFPIISEPKPAQDPPTVFSPLGAKPNTANNDDPHSANLFSKQQHHKEVQAAAEAEAENKNRNRIQQQ